MRRSLGRFDITCLGLNAIVGSGIFLLPDDLYRELGVLSPLAFATCALGLLPIAWCYSVAARSVDQTGGPYLYARRAFGDRLGFLVVWMCFANSLFSFAAVAGATAAYAGRLLPALSSSLAETAVAVAVIGVLAALNVRGAKPGALAINTFTIGKFLVLGVLISALLPEFKLEGAPVTPAPSLGNWTQATFVALFAAQGFEVVPVPAGEVRRPQRDVPFAVLAALLLASLVYVVVQLALIGSGAELGAISDTPLVDAALSVAPRLGLLVAMGGLISTLGFVSGSALGTPRYLYAAAAGGQLPAPLAQLHPRFGSPHVAILVTAGLAIAATIPFDYRSLIGMSNVAAGVQYLATCLAVAKLAEARPSLRWLPWLGAGVSLWIFTEASEQELIWAGAVLLVGLLLSTRTRWGGNR